MVMVRPRCGRGTVEVHLLYGCGAVKVHLWYGRGVVEVCSWCGRGTHPVHFQFVAFVIFLTGDLYLPFRHKTYQHDPQSLLINVITTARH